ncbi:M23 family metallopeptidase [Paenibacillus macerans]|uniref:Peptidase M23 family protein n=1 Tax=Paenibacillus macerans TaxID=44252 RepID=A0A090YSG5_PAEMA|nr:M23 family metallopeptidase [Paenibacillus macerans]KFN00908.1 peptidase M23 family protein [Paenibacillus macerans]MBS5911923.1 M23 family metallopeptidase [Paenibacillus macerans]MCY7558084.1 peptidoglycan DD-metalloendopeptidase family protein [Paenibacillus macerans]MEC0135556.1 M23 family metallopeptidase [Paenibacillus macerans]MEC0153679.1 M23 family metallopeptidase [Paenibacillus macerans]
MRSVSLPNPNRMTLLVLRDANQPVKQVQVSKPLVVAVPLLALLSISGLIVSLQIQSDHTVSRLEKQLKSQTIAFEAVVTDKNEAIQRLQNEVIALSGQSKDMMDRMERVAELEAQLQKFIDKYGDSKELGKLSSLSWDNSQDSLADSGIGGEFIAVHDNEIETLARETSDDFAMMSDMLDEMEKNVPVTLKKARQTQYSISGTPSEWPTLSTRLTSNFGYRTDPFSGRAAFHAGIDIGGKLGDPVYAAGAGKVITTDKDSSHGRYIVIEHPGGLQSWYLHLNEIGVIEGDTVDKGQQIGKLGSSGRSTGPHLHFEIVKAGKPVDPLPYLK